MLIEDSLPRHFFFGNDEANREWGGKRGRKTD
jgi:hypothetical protein